MQRVPPEQTLDETNRRDNNKKNKGENDSRHDERKHFGQSHPCLVWQDERFWEKEPEKQQDAADRQRHLRHTVKLSAVQPPGTQQDQHAANDETELPLGSLRLLPGN